MKPFRNPLIAAILLVGILGVFLQFEGSSNSENSQNESVPPTTPHGNSSQSATNERGKSKKNQLSRNFNQVIDLLKTELRTLEQARIVVRSTAIHEVPVKPEMVERLQLPPGTTTKTVDANYLSLRAPTEEEKIAILNLIDTASIKLGNLGPTDKSDLMLNKIKNDFLNYPKQNKLLVLTRARTESGRYSLTAYDCNEVYEQDIGNGIELSPEQYEGSFEEFDLPFESISRYGFLFGIREE